MKSSPIRFKDNMLEHTVGLIAVIFLICALCQWIAWRVKLPPILFLLLAGILIGPATGTIDVDALFGDLLYPFVSLSVAIILFEGSLTLRFKEIAGLEKVVRNLVSVGMIITWLITATVTHFALSISWEISLIFGAIVVVTGPTVVAPIIKTIRPTAKIANILRWESIVIDPIGASLAVLVYEFIVSGGGQFGLGQTLLTFGRILLVGGFIGLVSGYFFGTCLRRHWIPEYLHNISTMALVFISFSLANLLQAESGLVTVTCMGILLANMRDVDIKEILSFKETLSTILISLLFVTLAARLDYTSFVELGWPALAVFLSIQFIARPLSVMVCTFRSSLRMEERHLLAWIAPRGIVAAAISALFTFKLQENGVSGASALLPLTFMVIIGTVVLQSSSAKLIAGKLGVVEPDPHGFLIVGANKVAREIALALFKQNIRVVVADTSEENIANAKKMGLETYLGNPVSGNAERFINLTGIGRMLAISKKESFNVAAIFHYRIEFGLRKVFMIRAGAKRGVSSYKKHFLFGNDADYQSLEKLLTNGGSIICESVNDTELISDTNSEVSLNLFAVHPSGKVILGDIEKQMNSEKGWKVIRAIPPSMNI